jgi:uncharacterized protein (DUF2336 family)
MPGALLIPELEDVLQHASSARRAETLRRITALFVEGAGRFNDDHVQLFEEVFIRLMGEVDTAVRTELSHRLAPIRNAPRAVLRRLAEDDDIAAARPVLKQSLVLAESDLVDIAQTKSQAHLLAVSKRGQVAERVTDILVRCGDREVLGSLSENPGAQLSEASFAALIARAAEDSALAQKVGMRRDLPPRLLRDLLRETTHAVQQRLLAAARPEQQSEIRRLLTELAHDARSKVARRDYTAAERKILELRRDGKLDEATLVEFANNAQHEETVAALASLCVVPIDVVDRLLAAGRADPILILCKSAGWGWQTVKAIMTAMPAGLAMSSRDLDAAYANFERLSPTTAQRVMRFWQVQHWQHAPAEEISSKGG